MLVKLSLIVLALASLTALAAGLGSALRQLFFLRRAYRVRGTVIGEWRYVRWGLTRRYYRVEFQLRNGQRAQLRSQVSGGTAGPKMGQWVPVLIVERDGRGPRAKIGTWAELWYGAALCLGLGGLGLLTMVLIGLPADTLRS